MMEYIDKEFLYEQMNSTGAEFSLCDALEMIEQFPIEDVAPVVHGRWEFLGPNMLIRECMCGTCSACKVRSKYIVNPMLCPNCGAKMDGGAEDGRIH